MDGDSLCCLVIFVILVILGGYFAGSESCFSAMNKIRIKKKAENDGDKRAKNAMYISNTFDRAITTLLIGNNITHIAAASVATLFVTLQSSHGHFQSIDEDALTLLTTVITTGIVFLFSEMIPKSLANDRSDTMALSLAPSLLLLMKAFSPLVSFFTHIANVFTRLFKDDEDPSFTEEELKEIINTAEEQDVINNEQSDLLKSVLDFPETYASDVMTMRDDIVHLDIRLSNREMIDRIKSIPHSRILITDKTIDNVVGVLPIRRFLRAYMKNPKVDKRSVMYKPHFVDPHARIDELLDSMRQHKIYLGIVRDEEKKVVGVVTIEDFLEELVGEIWDEEDIVDYDFFKLGGNKFSVSASLRTSEVFERMGIKCPDNRIAGYTLGVWVTETLGHLPEKGESFIYGENLEITVEKVSKTRILTVIIHIMDEDDLAELESNSNNGSSLNEMEAEQ